MVVLVVSMGPSRFDTGTEGVEVSGIGGDGVVVDTVNGKMEETLGPERMLRRKLFSSVILSSILAMR